MIFQKLSVPDLSRNIFVEELKRIKGIFKGSDDADVIEHVVSQLYKVHQDVMREKDKTIEELTESLRAPVVFHYCTEGKIRSYPSQFCSLCTKGNDFNPIDKIKELQNKIKV